MNKLFALAEADDGGQLPAEMNIDDEDDEDDEDDGDNEDDDEIGGVIGIIKKVLGFCQFSLRSLLAAAGE